MNRVSLIIGAAVSLAAQNALGQTTWTNAAGGSANLSSNWSAGTPASGIAARFDLAGPYTLSFDGPLQASTVDVNAGIVTLDLNRQTWTVGGPISIGPITASSPAASPTLVVSEGRLSSPTNTLTVGRSGVMGTLAIRDGGSVDVGQLRLENNSYTSVVGSGSALNFNVMTTPAGSISNSQVLVADGASMFGSSTSTSNPPALALLTVRGAGSRVRGIHATMTRLEAGASAEFGTLNVQDFIADASTITTSDLFVGPSSPASVTPPGRLLLRNSTLVTSINSGSPLRVYGSSTLELDGALIQSNRTLANDGLIHGSGRSTGHLENNPTGSVSVGAGDRLSFEGRGGSNFNRGLINVIGGELTFAGVMNNTSGSPAGGRIVGRDATLRFGDGTQNTGLSQTTFSSLTLTGGVNDVFGFISNGGKIVHTGNSRTIYYDAVINHTTIQTAQGSSATFLGDVNGSGTFTGTGDVAFYGNVAPGASPALVTFGGDVAFDDSSTLILEVGGITRGTGYDALDVAGSLRVDGTIRVERLGNFIPHPGQRFDFLDAATLTGTPTIENATGLAGLRFNTDFTDGNLSIDLSARAGDANLDNAVNFADLVKLAQNYNQQGKAWIDGDFNADQAVNFADLVLLAQQYNRAPEAFAAEWAMAQSFAGTAVPEPTTITAFLGVAAMVFRRGTRTQWR